MALLKLQDLHSSLKTYLENKASVTQLNTAINGVNNTINSLDANNIKKTGGTITGNLNVTTINDGTPWTSANDGVGSGLDAGLFAGQAPAYYTNITARLGYTPLNSTTYTASDILTKLKTVDGVGSGLDADLLAGLAGSAYQLKVNRVSGTIPTTGWTSHTASPESPSKMKVDITVAGLVETNDVDIIIPENYQFVAHVAGINPTCKEGTGKVTVYAIQPPSTAIPITIRIFK